MFSLYFAGCSGCLAGCGIRSHNSGTATGFFGGSVTTHHAGAGDWTSKLVGATVATDIW